MMTAKDIKKFNTPETLVVISVYPKKGELYSQGTSGVASYAKNVVRTMKRKVVVLADVVDQPHFAKASRGEPEIYQEGKALVVRCFEPGKARLWLQILQELWHFRKVKRVLVHFDFSIYGGIVPLIFMLPFLAVLKIFGFVPFVVAHHVVLDVKDLSGHVGLGTGKVDKVKGWLYSLAFRNFYRGLGWVSAKIVLLEQALTSDLAQVVAASKIAVVPHAVDTGLRRVAKHEARRKLGVPRKDLMVLFFGYMNWFKGADIFAETFSGVEQMLSKKVHFVMAGGESPTMRGKGFYQSFFAKVQSRVKDSKAVTMTGYVPQESIKDYFCAADIVVFPYRALMCASGVLSLAFSYRTPFLMSQKLSGMLMASDIASAMKSSGLKRGEASVVLSPAALRRGARELLKDGVKQKMIRMAGMVRKERSFGRTAWAYQKLIFSKAYAKSLTFAKLGRYGFSYGR